MSALQVSELHEAIERNEHVEEYLPYIGVIRNYLDTQDFNAGVENSNIELLDQYQSLMMDYEELKGRIADLLKRIEVPVTDISVWYEPNWLNAQEEAAVARLSVCWYDTDENELIGFRTTVVTYVRPIEPTVEVDQVWRHKDIDCYEDSVKVIFVSEQTVGVVTFHNDEVFFKKSKFIELHERVVV